MQFKIIFMSIFLALSLSHCSSYDFSRRVIQQGNLLPQSKLERLKLGMTKEDVSVLMGSSLLNSPFNNNRWDFAYSTRTGLGSNRIKHLVLHFKNDRLIQIEKSPLA